MTPAVFLQSALAIVHLAGLGVALFLFARMRHWAWALVALAFGGLTARTGTRLYLYASRGEALPELEAEITLLIISLLLVISLICAIPIIRSASRAIEGMKESERKLATLLGNLPGLAYRCLNNPEWTMEFISDGCLKLTGYPASHLLHNSRVSFADLIHPDDRQNVWEGVQKALAEKRAYQLTYRIKSAAGEERWVWEQGCGVFSPDGSVTALEGFITDITDRKRSELQVKESETRFRQITENLRDVFWLTDWTQRKVEYVSPAYEAVWGRSCESLYRDPKSWRDVLHPDDREAVIRAFENAGPSTPFDLEYRIVREDGAVRWIHDRAIPILGEDGTIQRMAGFSEDITARKEAEFRRWEDETRLRLLLEQMPAIVWTVDADLRFDSSAGAGLAALGLKPDQTRGMPMTEYFGTTDPAFPPIAMHRRALAGESVKYDTIWAGRTYRCYMEPRRTVDGRINGVIGVALDVTDQKRAEERLVESEWRFRGAFDHAPIGGALIGADNCIQQVNGSLLKMLGYTESELVGRSFDSIAHPDDVTLCRKLFEDFRAGSIPCVEVSKRYLHKDGSIVWTEVTGSPVRDASGRPVHFVVQIKDVTRQRAAAEALRESEEKYRTLAEAAQDSIFVIDRDDRVVFVNEFGATQLQARPEQLIGRKRSELFLPGATDRFGGNLKNVFENGKIENAEILSRFPDGEHWLHTRLTPLYDEKRSVRAVLGISRDITDRKRAEEALLRSEEYNRRIIEAIPGGVVQINREGRIVGANAEAPRLMGMSMDELLSRTIFDFAQDTIWENGDPCPPEQYPEWKALQTGEAQPPVTIGVRKPNGETCWAIYQAVPHRDPHTGEVIGAVVTFLDITERRQAEQLRRERDIAEAANRAKNAFLANVSHEIRTPLMSILGAGEFLRGRLGSPDGEIDHIDMILRNGRHLLALVNDLLDLARIEAGKLDVYPMICSLTELLADVQAVVAPLHSKAGVELSFDCESRVPVQIRTDPMRLKQAVINLIGNALKFTDSGSVRVRYSVICDRDEPHLKFIVEDTGIGIRPENVEYIFQAFTRTTAPGDRVRLGTGLGLPLTLWIARELGGRLEVDSEPGRGSRFTLIVPCGRLDDVEWLSPPRLVLSPRGLSVPPAPYHCQDAHGSILLAEDDPDVRLLLSDVLSRAGAEVVAVENGRDAVDIALRRSFDLMLFDVRMPVMTGIEAIGELRKQKIMTPAMALTASTAQAEVQRLREAGFDELWPKPIALEELVDKVSAFLPDSGVLTTASKPRSILRPETLAERLEQAIEEFKISLPARLQRIEDAVLAGDRKETYEALHQLAGTSGHVNLTELSQETRRLLTLVKVDRVLLSDDDLKLLRDMVSNQVRTVSA